MTLPKPKKIRVGLTSQSVTIRNDEKSEKLRKTLEILVKYCENELQTSKSKKDEYSYGEVGSFFLNRDGKLLPTARDMMMVLRSCLISHRFQAAAHVLELLSLEMNYKDHAIFAGGLEVLENHPDATSDLMEYFIRNVSSLHLLNKKEIVLEYIMYKFKNNQPQQIREAVQLLLRQKKLLKKNAHIDPIFKAYSVLIDYVSWARLKERSDVQESEMSTFKKRIVETLSEVLQSQGQWDIFVSKLIEVMEFYKEIDEGEAILEKHLETNAQNINAHIYLLEFLKKHERKNDRQVECLKNISRISPSDPLVLELAAVLLKENKSERALRLLFKFVDYADNKNNLACWKMIAQVGVDILKCPNDAATNVLQNTWRKSRSYWPLYHFDADAIDVRSKADARLLVHKSTFLAVVGDPKENPYFEAVRLCIEDYPKYANRLGKTLSKVQVLKSCIKL